jgi:ketosteroid isomerase-like protein
MRNHLLLNLVALGLGATIDLLPTARAHAEAPMGAVPNVSFQLAQASPSSAGSASEKDAIHKVVSEYYDAVSKSSTAAAVFYGEPTLMVLPNEVTVFSKRADVETFFAKLLATLKPLGYSCSKLIDPRIKPLNATTAMYGTIAVRFKADGTEIQRAGFTYLLKKDNSGWKIHELIATDLDKLISGD